MSKLKQLISPHNHSHYSLDGAATVEDMVIRAVEQGSPYLALTEHGNMNSSLELYEKSKKHGIKPILGIELYIIPPFLDELRPIIEQELTKKFDNISDKEKAIEKALANEYAHLTIHFKDEWAYQYFSKLTPKMEERALIKYGERKPLATLEEVAGASGHIIVCSSCLVGIASRFILPRRKSGWTNKDLAEKSYHMLRDIAGADNFFVEIFPHEITKSWKKPDKENKGHFVPHECTPYAPDGDIQKPVNNFMLEMAKKNNDNIIVSLDAHFARPEQELVQISRLGNGKEAWRFSNSYHMYSSDESYKILQRMHGIDLKTMESWIDNSYKWASNFDSFKMSTKKDRFIMGSLDEHWQDRVVDMINSVGRMDWSNQTMINRLKHEIDTITNNGHINLMPYFFTVSDIATWARSQGILVNPRGSGSGSLLLYLIGVSGINPLKYNLSFDRFLTKGRISGGNMADIDLDFSNQHAVFDHLKDKYGDAFCNISIDTQLKLKSSIKDAERSILGAVTESTEKLCKILPASPQGTDEHDYVFGYTDDLGVVHQGLIDTNAALRKYSLDPKNEEIWATVKEMLGINRQKSRHPCSVVIADRPVQDYIPITYIGDSKITGFGPKAVEAAGLIKYDILGVNTLRDIQSSLNLIKSNHGIDLDIYNLPYSEECFRNFQSGRTETVFQFDTPTIIPYLKSTYPVSIEDLTALTALGRPGTLDAPESDTSHRTLAQVYVARSNGEPITYIHPELKPILKETRGIMLYQEQSMQIFKDIAGYSDEQSDEVRRAIGKKDKKLLEKQTGELKERILNKGNWTEEQVSLLIQQLMASANYSFNKSHAAAYSVIAYANQYLKTYYPIEWWTSILSNASKDDLKRYWPYAVKWIKMPDINASNKEFYIVKENGESFIQAPITLLDGVGSATTEEIELKKPFVNFEDFFSRIDRRIVNKRTMFKFILSGLVDTLFEPGTSDLDKVIKYLDLRKELDNGKAEQIPEDMLNMSQLQQLFHKRSIFTVYNIDWTEASMPYLVSRGLAKKSGQVYSYIDPNSKDLNGRVILDTSLLKMKLDPNNQNTELFGVVGYVYETKETSYNKKTPEGVVPNTMMKFSIECGDTNLELIKWPDWESTTHGIDKDLSERVCLFLIQKKNDSYRGIQLTVKKVIDITNIK